jgi:transposase InsO family protein
MLTNRADAVSSPDNGNAYRSTIHALACKAMGIKHLRTRPYRPRTNGKAERFIRTLLAGWAYGGIYRNSDERHRALSGWLDFDNRRRLSAASAAPSPARALTRTRPEQRSRVLHLGRALVGLTVAL